MRRLHSCANPVQLRHTLPQGRIFFGDDVAVSGCTTNVDRVQPGDLFVAMSTFGGDTHELAQTAVERGAVAVVGERLVPLNVPQCLVEDSREAYGSIQHALFGNPSRKLPVVGVTGTLGKTTVALLTASVLNRSRRGVAAMTTLAHCDSLRAIPAKRTTPSARDIAKCLSRSVENGCTHAVVELSSSGLAERRTAGLELSSLVLTNIRRDHVRRHGTLSNYRSAKQQAFSLLRPDGAAVINADDPGSASILAACEHPTLTFGLHREADVTARVISRCTAEQVFLLEAGSDSVSVRTRMLGDHHLYNCLAAAAVGLLHGIELIDVAQGLEEVESIPGRMDRIECGQDFRVFIDEARTHDALASALKAARQVTRGRVICVVSASDDGSPQSRPLLGKVAEQSAQYSILTGDGDLTDDTLAAVHEMLDGFSRPGRAHVIPGRKTAIEWALDEASDGDTVLICGQGHRSWRTGKAEVDDATIAREKLYAMAADDCRRRPLVFAYSG